MTLIKYLLKRFVAYFFGTLVLCSLMVVFLDLMMNMVDYIECAAPLKSILKVMWYFTPKAIWYCAPLATLFAVSLSLSTLYSTNELTVIFTSGVSLFKFTLPLIIISIFLSFGFFYFENTVVVPTLQKKVELQNQLLMREKYESNSDVVIIAEQGKIVYKADFYNDLQKTLKNLYVIIRDENYELDRIVHSNLAYWNESDQFWEVSPASVYRYRDGFLDFSTITAGLSRILVEPPDTFKNFEVNVEEVDTETAREYIKLRKRAGLPYAEALSVYYKKYSFPFVIFLVVFLSIGLSCKSRKNVFLIGLILCVCSAVAFFVVQMVTMYLAKFGYIPPIYGGWFPVILFTIISVVLLRYSKT